MTRHLRLVAIGALAAVPLLNALHAQAPYSYAIQGARIVPVSGPVIDNGTIVVRDGVITAVGPGVPPPPARKCCPAKD